jgi:hypothetical protein
MFGEGYGTEVSRGNKPTQVRVRCEVFTPLIRGTVAPTSILLRYMKRLEVNPQLILDSTVVLAFQAELAEVE